MKFVPITRRRLLVALAALALPAAVLAHASKLGDIEIDHAYATPTPEGASYGAVYFRALENGGRRPDRLVAAATPMAEKVEFHRGTIDAQHVMRTQPIDGIEMPPRSALKVRHNGELHLVLVGLKQPLAHGEKFPLLLRFEHAGEREVTVYVQQPRDRGGSHGGHRH